MNSAKQEQFQRISLNLIDAGPTNPRKTFETPDWPEFVASVRTHGVMQPGLCRPSPKRAGRFELVAGERRFRASMESGQKDMPLMVRDLTDAEVVELQQIENLQREDLSVMEEAQGYADWVKALMRPEARGAGHEGKVTFPTKEEAVAHICERIHKKRSHVWDRLRLLDTVAPVQEAVRSGKLEPSKATLIAKVPKSLQPVVAKRAIEGEWGNGPMSYRALNDLIAEEYRQPLKGAQFDIKKDRSMDATRLVGRLNLAAGVVMNWGPCVTCPHRAGNLPDAESDDYTCTNPPCYQAKQQLHAEDQLAEAQATGKKVVTVKEFRKDSSDFRRTNQTCYEDGKSRTYGELAKLAGIKPALTITEDFELVEVFSKSEMAQIRQHHKIGANSDDRDRAKQLAEQRKEKELKLQCGVAAGFMVPKLVAAMATAKAIPLWKRMALAVNSLLDIDRQAIIAKRRGLAKVQGEVRDGLRKWLGDHRARTTDEYQGFVIEALLMSNPIEGGGWSGKKLEIDKEFVELAEMVGVDVEASAPEKVVLVGGGKVQLAQAAVAAINKGLKGAPAKGKKPKQTKLI